MLLVTVSIGSVQVQAWPSPRMEEEMWHEDPTINEELLAIDSGWEKQAFSKNVAPGKLTPPVEDYTPQTILAEQPGLDKFKK